MHHSREGASSTTRRLGEGSRAPAIVLDAEKRRDSRPGGVIVEGTAGNTGIGFALVGNARGYKTVIVIPETQSQEKKDMLRLCGAELREVPAVPYKDPDNYVRVSERLAKELGGFYANQWDNLANRTPTIAAPDLRSGREPTAGWMASSAPSGPAGRSPGPAFLKDQHPDVAIAAADPMGAAMYHYFTNGELKRRRELRSPKASARVASPGTSRISASTAPIRSPRRRFPFCSTSWSARASASADRAASTSPERSVWHAISAPATRSSRYWPTPVPATNPSSGTRRSCARAGFRSALARSYAGLIDRNGSRRASVRGCGSP